MKRRGSALVEFALAWPVLVLAVFAAIQLAVWATEEHAAGSAALAGARAGSASGASADVAATAAVAVLRPSLIGVTAVASCPPARREVKGVWVCAHVDARSARVEVGGGVPALLPLLGGGLPLHAHVELARETFAR